MKGLTKYFASLCAVCVLLIFIPRLHAQNLTGEIDGTVKDGSGAVIPNATVTLTNVDQNLVSRSLTTNAEGEFNAPLLAIGNYSIAAGITGFQVTHIERVEVHVNSKTAVPIVLSVGSTSSSVTVVASSVAPETQSAAASTLISGTQVRQLSLSSRNYQQLLSLQPGVTGPVPGTTDRGIVASSGSYNQANFQVNGQRPTQNEYYLDGSDMVNHGGDLQTGGFPSIDAIQEMNITRNSYGAQYGGGGSGIVSLQTRSGSTAFHGSAYAFLRSQVLNANSYFNNLAGVPRPGIRYNDFGYSLGGPVWIPHLTDRNNAKTFFFFTQEYLRSETSSGATYTNVPTLAQRQGIFAAPVCVAYSGSTCTQSSNQIAQFDPTAQAYVKDILNKLPLPNSPTDPQGLIVSQSGINNETQTVIRIDHQFSQRLNVFFRYLDDPFHLIVPSGQLPGVNISTVADGGTNYLGHATFILTPKTLFEGGYTYQAIWINMASSGLITQASSPDIDPTLPNPNLTGIVPSLSIGGLSISGAGPNFNPGHNSQVFLNVTHTLGRHTLYFGGDFEDTVGAQNNAASNGTFSFSASALPTGSTATQFMQAYANFLRGSVTTFTQPSANTAIAIRGKLYEGYLQDDFRPTSRLTVNAGVRYTHIVQPVGEPFMGQSIPISSFDPRTWDPTKAPTVGSNGLICTQIPCPGGGIPNANYDPMNGIITAGSTSPYGKSVNSSPNLNFAPRLGFAWDVFGDGSTSLRGGVGIYFIQTLLGISQNEAFNNPPYSKNITIANTIFSNPGSTVPTTSYSPLAVYGSRPNWKIPYSQSWSLDLQQQVGKNAVFDIGYYGNRGTDLLGAVDLNQPIPGAYAQKGIIPGNIVTPANSIYLNQIRPYLGWGNMTYIQPTFFSTYNSLQTSVRKHLGANAQASVNYTWSRSLANSASDRGNPPQNIYNLRAEYGPTSYNRTNVLNANFVYTLPFFEEQKGFKGHILGGWEAAGIISYGSGLPVSPATINVDPGGLGLLLGGGPARPDQVSNPNTGGKRQLKNWFNTSAFAYVPAGQYRPGNASVGAITGPGYGDWDLSLFKNIHVADSAAMQLRAESFNAFNHTNFGGVAATLGNSNYGQITGASQNRVLQLAAKFTF
jgi:hypothetical protein